MHLLLVEDHDAYAESFVMLIDAYAPDATVVHARTLQAGADALELYGPFDVVVVDLSLPDAKETVAVRLLVRMAPDTPIVVLTAYPQFEGACLHLGADAYLLKCQTEGEELVSILARIASGGPAHGAQ